MICCLYPNYNLPSSKPSKDKWSLRSTHDTKCGNGDLFHTITNVAHDEGRRSHNDTLSGFLWPGAIITTVRQELFLFITLRALAFHLSFVSSF